MCGQPGDWDDTAPAPWFSNCSIFGHASQVIHLQGLLHITLPNSFQFSLGHSIPHASAEEREDI
jgi:hypothetical protein